MTTETTQPGASKPRKSAPGLLHSIGQGIKNLVIKQYRRTSTSSLHGVAAMLVSIALGLTVFGLTMVLSASSVEQIALAISPFQQVIRQAIFAIIGFVAMGILAFLPVTVYRNRMVMHGLLAVALLMQILVVFVGTTVNGNQNWIQFGGISLQPSEISKLIMALWMAWVLTQQGNITRQTRKAIFPLAFGFVPLVGLILYGGDLGTVLVYVFMLVGTLFIAGLSPKAFLIGLGVAAVLGLGAVITSPYRLARVFGVLGHCEGSTCDQSNSGLAALATGGFWGVGLGRSRQKYNYLPEAHNDYIFAVIGEELGLLGTLIIIALYAGLIYCVVRILLRSADRFVSLASGAILIWLTSQAIVNISMVTGMLPVIGIPLPFISYGGSSLVSSLMAVGVLIAFARQAPLMMLTEDGTQVFSVSPTARESKRRARLGRVVEAENRRLAREGDNAGYDVNNLIDAIRGRTPGNRSARPRNARPASARPADAVRPASGGRASQPATRQRTPGAERPRDNRVASRTAAERRPQRAAEPRTESRPERRRREDEQRHGNRPQQGRTTRPKKTAGSTSATGQRSAAHPADQDHVPQGLVSLKKLRQRDKK